jgi:uncharacterized damage-inducible protein DinB
MADALFDPVRHIVGRLRRTVHGPMWHGPSLSEVLRDVDADLACRRDVAGVHSIWALVRHMTVWAEIARARLDGERLDYPPVAEDWPIVDGFIDSDIWLDDGAKLFASYEQLSDRASALVPADLLARVPEQDYSVATMLDGVIEHGVWHGGQIALLKRAAASR